MRALKLTNEELAALCAGLSHLYHSGIGGGDGLALLAQDETDRQTRSLLETMARRADEGVGLGQVCEEQGCFPPYLCRLLKVADGVGRTEQTLEELGEHYHSRARMEQRLRASLLYPAVLLAVMLAVVVVLMVWVLPVFNDVYARLGSQLTGLAGGLLAVGQGLRRALPVLGAAAGAAVLLMVVLGLCPGLAQRMSGWWRTKWAHRGVNGKINAARFLQAIAMGLSSGMTQQEAVALAQQLMEGCGRLETRAGDCLALVERGDGLADVLRCSGLITAAHSRVLEAGLRAGRGEQVLAQIARRELEQGEAALEQAAARVEPALVVITCVMVGIILLSVMLPLMHIMNGIG